MRSPGELRIDPGRLGRDASSGEMEVVVAYTDPDLARSILHRAATLTEGLQVRIWLVAVHAVPFPADFRCAPSAHAFLVDQLRRLADDCFLPVSPQVVLARSREDGFRYALPTDSIVLVGARRHWWRTSEERLARMLASAGHRVALVHVD
jgi:hypothetical protein